jgi:betaine reductase
VVVLLGTPTPESSQLYALTVTEGDPSWAGALAGVALNLPVYHILEPGVRAAVPADTYEAEVGVAQYALDAEAIEGAVRGVRERRP